MLRVEAIDVSYGDYLAVADISLRVEEGEIVALLGLNGSGKSTVVNAISGLVRHRAGSIEFCGVNIGGCPANERVRLGISHVPERRRVFPYMSVLDNLLLGAYLPGPRQVHGETLEMCVEMFPTLGQRARQLAGTLSGGEQQQLSMARGLMSRPRFLMLDEPFLGLSPRMVAEITNALIAIRERGITVLFVEQNVRQAMSFSDRGYLLESGRMVATGRPDELLDSDALRRTYLGVA